MRYKEWIAFKKFNNQLSFTSFSGPLSATIGVVSSILSFIWTFLPPPKSQELLLLERLETITMTGFKETWKQISIFRDEMHGEFAKIQQSLTDEIKKKADFDEYNIRVNKIKSIYVKHQIFLQTRFITSPNISINNYIAVFDKCTAENPVDVIRWLHEKLFEDETASRENLVDLVTNLPEYENDSRSLGVMLATFIYDTTTAYKMTLECIKLLNISGIKLTGNIFSVTLM